MEHALANGPAQTIPSPPTPISLTERAAEMVQKAMEQEKMGDHALRIGVLGGGCSGLQYLLDFAERPTDMDFVDEQHGVTIFVDGFSAGHLSGTVIDYVDSIQGSGFKFENPNIQRTCGCGSSFST